MTTPIERAARAVYEAGPGYELTGGKPWEDISQSSQDNMVRNARAAFNSIDVDSIAQAIHDGPEAQRQYAKSGIAPHSWADCTFREQYLNDARAVKAHLTGGTP